MIVIPEDIVAERGRAEKADVRAQIRRAGRQRHTISDAVGRRIAVHAIIRALVRHGDLIAAGDHHSDAIGSGRQVAEQVIPVDVGDGRPQDVGRAAVEQLHGHVANTGVDFILESVAIDVLEHIITEAYQPVEAGVHGEIRLA